MWAFGGSVILNTTPVLREPGVNQGRQNQRGIHHGSREKRTLDPAGMGAGGQRKSGRDDGLAGMLQMRS